MDNTTDLLLDSNEVAKRPPLYADGLMLPPLIAEHGFSALVDVYSDSKQRILFDTGVSQTGMLYNIDRLGIDLSSIDAIMLSHGHKDHFAGLLSTLKRMNRRIPLILHPDAFLQRFLIFPNGDKMKFPVLDETELTNNGADIRKIREPSAFGDLILATGEISRENDFEKGFPIQYAEINNELRPDPLIMDDQALVANIEGRGIVVITGCGHAGIINTINYAKKITDVESVYAVLGGFHLSGNIFEKIIERTVEQLQKIEPTYIVPCHCTGWKSAHRIANTMPDAFIQNSVGTKFVLQ